MPTLVFFNSVVLREVPGGKPLYLNLYQFLFFVCLDGGLQHVFSTDSKRLKYFFSCLFLSVNTRQ